MPSPDSATRMLMPRARLNRSFLGFAIISVLLLLRRRTQARRCLAVRFPTPSLQMCTAGIGLIQLVVTICLNNLSAASSPLRTQSETPTPRYALPASVRLGCLSSANSIR